MFNKWPYERLKPLKTSLSSSAITQILCSAYNVLARGAKGVQYGFAELFLTHLYWCKTWSLTSRGEHILRVFGEYLDKRGNNKSRL
jgi:hypothetical protein